MRSPSRRSFRRMNLRLIVAVSAVALAALACGPQESSTDAAGTWVGTITTEGDVTTVVNESGSVWGGVATLVEEVSIGLETGDVPYLFGRVGAALPTTQGGRRGCRRLRRIVQALCITHVRSRPRDPARVGGNLRVPDVRGAR